MTTLARSGLWMLAIPLFFVGVVLYHEPSLFLYLLAVAAVVTIAALANVAIARGRELDEIRGELERRERETPSESRATARRCSSRGTHATHLWMSGRDELHICPGIAAVPPPEVVQRWVDKALDAGRPDLTIVPPIPPQPTGEHDHLQEDDDFFGRLYGRDEQGDLL